MAKRRFSKKSQVWTIDYISGLLIFIAILLIGIKLILPSIQDNDYDSLYRGAVHLTDAIVSEGQPADWTPYNIISPGIMVSNTSNKLDLNKLASYRQIDYQRTKSLYHIGYDYLFYFENATGVMNITRCVFGYNAAVYADCKPDLSPINYDDLVKIDRVVIYNNTLVTMRLYVWN